MDRVSYNGTTCILSMAVLKVFHKESSFLSLMFMNVVTKVLKKSPIFYVFFFFYKWIFSFWLVLVSVVYKLHVYRVERCQDRWVFNNLQLHTLFALFNLWFERHWWVSCGRNGSLSYAWYNISILVSKMSLFHIDDFCSLI